MRYHNITKDDMQNGDGLRVVLWLSGCNHRCKGCHNPITWDPNGGLLFDEDARKEIWHELQKKWVEGITFSGGDPMHLANRKEVMQLMKEIKKDFPDKTIWLYTGYRLIEELDGFLLTSEGDAVLATEELLSCVDVLVDGKFSIEQRQQDIQDKRFVPWRGDSLQRVIDLKRTFQEREIILHETEWE